MSVTWTNTLINAHLALVLKREDLTDRIPEFVDKAERRIAREFRPRGFEVYASFTFTATTAGAIIDLPERYLETIGMWAKSNAAGTADGDVRNAVLPRSYAFVRSYWPDQTQTGLPKFHADMGQNAMIVAPTPSAAFTGELAFFQRLAPLDSNNENNWLTVHAPDLLISAALLESAPYLADDERIQTWQIGYDRLGAVLTGQEIKYRTSWAATPRKTVNEQ